MTQEIMTVLMEEVAGKIGEFVVASPAVGVILDRPVRGQGLEPGGRIGTLKLLNRFYTLTLPEQQGGMVLEVTIPDGHCTVGYGQPFVTIGPLQALTAGSDQTGASQDGQCAESGEILIKSPTDGIFYRKPDPGSPCYVEVGQTISSGMTLGLVEVMKCFNHIQFSGKDLPGSAKVIAIIPRDSSEVKAGQILFRLSPDLT